MAVRLREAEGVAELKETKQRAMELETQVGVLAIVTYILVTIEYVE